jgi:hypothetical protein
VGGGMGGRRDGWVEGWVGGGMGGFAKVDNEKWLQEGSMAFFSSLTIHRFFSFFHDIIS